MSLETYLTGIADQVQAAAARDDRAGIVAIIGRVQREQGPRVAEALTAAVLEHADKSIQARIRDSLGGDVP